MEFAQKKQVIDFLENFDDQYSKLIKDLKKMGSEITLEQIENSFITNYGKKTLVNFMSQLENEVSIITEEDFPDFLDTVADQNFDRVFYDEDDTEF